MGTAFHPPQGRLDGAVVPGSCGDDLARVAEKLLLFATPPRGGGRPADDQRPADPGPVATQLPRAVGLAYAAQYRGDVVVMAYFGDGDVQGDFHGR